MVVPPQPCSGHTARRYSPAGENGRIVRAGIFTSSARQTTTPAKVECPRLPFSSAACGHVINQQTIPVTDRQPIPLTNRQTVPYQIRRGQKINIVGPLSCEIVVVPTGQRCASAPTRVSLYSRRVKRGFPESSDFRPNSCCPRRLSSVGNRTKCGMEKSPRPP